MADSKTPDFDEDNFDAERAKRLVANLRADVDRLKGERDSIATERDEARSAAEAAKTATERAETAEKELWTERILRKNPELEGVEEFLTGKTEDELKAKAEKLAAKLGGKPADDGGNEGEDGGEGGDGEDSGTAGGSGDPDPNGSTGADGDGEDDEDDQLPGRPKPSLKPGHGGNTPEPFDPEAIAREARSSSY